MSLLRFVKLSESEVQKACDAYVQQIVSFSEPLAIYLFGSMADGKASIESDIDLLAIYEDGATAKAAQQAVMRQKSPYPMSADLVFVGLDAWMNKDRYSPLIETVRNEGKLLFQSAKMGKKLDP
jgi:predicted nucleotidyltransferase